MNQYRGELDGVKPVGLSDNRLVADEESSAWATALKVARRIERELGRHDIDEDLALRLAVSDDPFARQIGDTALQIIDRSRLPAVS